MDGTGDEVARLIEESSSGTPGRPPRILVIDIAPSRAGWIATSDQLEGFLVVRTFRGGIEEAVREDLAGWLDPAVTLEFRERTQE